MKTQLMLVMMTLLLAGTLGGCLGDDNPVGSGLDAEYVEEPVVGLELEIEEGSAYYGPKKVLRDSLWRNCGALGTTAGGACREHVPNLANDLPEVGDTDPAFDLIGTKISETSEDMIVTIELAELHEDWSHIEPDTRFWYEVKTEIDNFTGFIGLSLFLNDDEITFYSGYHEYDESCNDWWLCLTDIPVDFVHGRPGAIHLTVPRAIMSSPEIGDHVGIVEVVHGRNHYPTFRGEWDAKIGPAEEEGTVTPNQGWAIIDRWTGDEQFTFNTPRKSQGKAGLSQDRYDLPDGVPIGDDRPEIDIQSVEISETPTTFSLGVKIAEVEETPEDHSLWLAFGADDGPVPIAGYDVEDGVRDVYSGYEDMEQDRRWINLPLEFEIEPGQPGWLRFTWDRMDIGAPDKDDRLNFVYVNTWDQGAVLDETTAGPINAEAREMGTSEDWAGDGPPYWFQHDTTPPDEETLGLLVESATADAQLPPTLITDDVNEDQYDITYVHAEGRDSATAQVSLGVKDLSRVEVPRGYTALVYAVGIETDAGKFMVFLYKDDTQQDFYCATDTLALRDEPEDPGEVVWSRITGMVSHGGRNPVGDPGSTSGSISFQVPYECLGVADGESYDVHGLAGGSFLLEDSSGLPELREIHKVDSALAGPYDLPFQLGVESIQDDPKTAAWYTAPLGLNGQDWDVLGVAIALLLAAGGAFIVYQRRRKLRQYLNRVSHTAKIKDLTARETGLGELREALRADLISGKIAESHYTIVLRHIEDAMKHVRVKSIEETFRELPFHIVSKLRAVLNDGVITQDEREMVVDLVERANIPTNDKQKMLSRLERWQMVDEVAKA